VDLLHTPNQVALMPAEIFVRGWQGLVPKLYSVYWL